MVFDQCVSCPSCPLPSTAKAQWPGNRVWCNQGIWISKKKYLETLASAFAAQQYCAAKRVAKKLKTFKKFAFAAGSCSLLCDTDCFYCYYYPSHMSPHIYSHHYGLSTLVKFHKVQRADLTFEVIKKVAPFVLSKL